MAEVKEIEMRLLPEDADERRMFDEMVTTFGSPLVVVAQALAVMSCFSPQDGSYAKQLAIYANECLKAQDCGKRS